MASSFRDTVQVEDLEGNRVDPDYLRESFESYCKANMTQPACRVFVRWSSEFGYENLEGDMSEVYYAFKRNWWA